MWLFTSKASDSACSGKKVDFDSTITSYNFDVSSSYEIRGKRGLLWVFTNARQKKNDEEVTLIKVNSKSSSSDHLIEASIKRMKTLRHPNFLNWLAGIHDPVNRVEAFVVTERVTPLKRYLKQKADSGNFNFMASWGILQIARALQFLNENCHLYHNAIRLDSVVVNTAGEWKISILDYVSDEVDHDSPSQYECPDDKNVDSYGLGCLIWEIFNVYQLESQKQLTTELERIPTSLIKDFKRLVSAKSAQRYSIGQFIKSATNKQTPGFLFNDYVDTLLFLEEIQIKDKEERIQFMSKLGETVSSFPDDICKHKILPHLINGLQFGSAGIEVLVPVLKLAPLLQQKDFDLIVLPGLVKLFNSPDRMTRVRLLEQLPNFVSHLPEKVVQTQIFTPVCQGFSDVNPVVREATVKSMVHFAERLTPKMLNDQLARQLIQIQAKDEQGGVRANASVCLAKLFDKFSQELRQGMLLNAFLRSTRDPFPPSREIAVSALAATQQNYSAKDLACKLLPCLAFGLVDGEKSVREQSFKAVHEIVQRIETMHNEGELDVIAPPQQHQQQQAPQQQNQAQASSSSSSADILGSFASMAFTVSNKLISHAMQQQQQQTSSPMAISNQQSVPRHHPVVAVSSGNKAMSLQQNKSEASSKSGWEDNEDWGSSDFGLGAQVTVKPVNKTASRYDDGWDDFTQEADINGGRAADDGWDDFDEAPVAVVKKPTPVAQRKSQTAAGKMMKLNSASSRKVSTVDQDRDTRKLSNSSTSKKPAEKDGDGWGDW